MLSSGIMLLARLHDATVMCSLVKSPTTNMKLRLRIGDAPEKTLAYGNRFIHYDTNPLSFWSV